VRQLACTYEIVESVPGARLVTRTAEGPFPMETTSTWQGLDGPNPHGASQPRNAHRILDVRRLFMASAMRRAKPEGPGGALWLAGAAPQLTRTGRSRPVFPVDPFAASAR
jgi:hypothetical protein